MSITEIQAKSILLKRKKIDSWFISRYGMNLYRGCTHNCVYCDGRAEGYYVEGVFGRDVAVKVNAIEVLSRELDPRRKRTPFKRGFIMLGGGVGDSYQPLDNKYQLSRKALHLLCEHNFPVHVLTKSTLVERDLDIIKKINSQTRAIVSFSLSSADDAISAIFEPGVPPPSERFKTLQLFKKEGISCGIFLLPVIPLITDTPEKIEETVRKASEAVVDFIIFGGMTLKDGRQKDYFLDALGKHYPQHIAEYQNLYRGQKWGEATGDYYSIINKTFHIAAKKYKMPQRVPPALFKDILDENDLVVVMLEHIDYLLKMEGEKSSFGYAAYNIAQVPQPLSSMKGELRRIKGVNKAAEDIILEILETRTSSYLDHLLKAHAT